MKFSKHFENSIPFEKREDVLKKIVQFEKDLKEYKSFNNLPRGYNVRQIEGTDIYKFRINNGDRVLYQYDNISSDIVIIEYCKHDDQVRRAKSSNTSLNRSGIYEYTADDYIEKEIDENIDDLVLENYINEYLEAVLEYELNDSTIALGVESDSLEDKKYLTLEQFSCIKGFKNPKIILGCAGSGKTLIGIKRLILNNRSGIKTAYITNSRRLDRKSVV